MFDKLRKMDWSSLEIASGPADSVPVMIEDLTSNDPDVVEEAMLGLSSSIWEHGIVFDATIAAIPFLIALLESGEASDPAGVIDLLSQIAESRDLEEVMLPPAHEYQFMPDQGEVYTKDEQEMQWSQEAYAEIGKGIPTFLGLLEDDDPYVRSSTAALLEMYPASASQIAPALRDAIDREDDIATASDLMLSLRDLLRSAVMVDTERAQYVDYFRQMYADETEPSLRLAAAIAAMRLKSPDAPVDADMLAAITDAVTDPTPYADYSEDTLENPVQEALALLLDAPEPLRSESLIKATRASKDPANARSMALALLVTAFGREPLEQQTIERPDGSRILNPAILTGQAGAEAQIPLRTSLTPEQRQIVEALLDSDAFWVAPGSLLYIYGLPMQRNALLEYLDDPAAFASRN
jgi:hypothetical protein